MASSIPLRRLPLKAIKVVFGQLFKCDVDSIVCFSTCSTKSKLLVQSMKLKAHFIYVSVRDGFSISLSLFNEHKYSVLNPSYSSDLGTLTPCQISLPGSSTILSKPSVKDWIDHFLYIFNKKAIDLQFGSSDDWIYSLESIYESLRGLKLDSLHVYEVDEEEISFEILGFFNLMTDLYMGEFDRREEPDVSKANLNQLKKIVIGNNTTVCLRQNIPLDLNTLLMMNGIEISLSSPRLTDREFNMFLKLWIKGSNPKLEKLYCFYPEDGTRQFAKFIILKGIQYKKQPRRLRRMFQPDHHKPNGFISLVGGYDIWRKDQTTATVFFELNRFAMYVWSSTNTYTADEFST